MKSVKSFARETMTLKTGAAAVLLVAACTVYALSLAVPVGFWTYVAGVPPLVFILLTGIARVNDINEDTVRWHVRRLGLLGVCGGCVAVMTQPLLLPGDAPSWGELMLRYGFAVTWGTTPNMPPWWRFMGQQDPRAEKRDAELPL